jgi:hypothetical protein
MSDANTTEPPLRGFPFVTVAACLAMFFAFLGLCVLAYNSPNYLGDAKPVTEPKADPATRLDEIRAKNEAVLAGDKASGAKMSVHEATEKLLAGVKGPKDKLPFPKH